MDKKLPDGLESTSLGEEAAIGRIQKALFGGDDRLVNVGRYEIRELIGSGAFGKVYRARDPQLDRDVALKVLAADGTALDDDDREELLREARVMAALGHPNIVAVHDAGVVDHAGRVRVFIAMELVAGSNLRAWLATAPRTRAAILDVMCQVGRGVAAAHAAGVVHRDLKPDNILVGDDGRARVVDFGLARTHSPAVPAPDELPIDRATVTGAIAGTPAYMAPELLAGRPADRLTDQFAFCVTLWEALHGERPFGGSSVLELRAAMARPLARRAGLAKSLQGVLSRGLAPEPSDRFASLDELVTALELPRSRWVVPVALATTAAAGLAIGLTLSRSSNPADLPDPCPVPTAELAGIWDPAHHAAIAKAFHDTGLPFADDTFARVAPALDKASTAWLDAHRDACLATAVKHDQSPELLDRRMSCLRDWRRELRALVDAFAMPTPAVVQGAVRGVAALPDLARCADRDALAAGPAPPSDPAIRARLDELSDKLARARGLLLGGPQRAGEAIALVDEVALDELATKHVALAIAVAQWRADASTALGRYDDARAAARSAFDLAVGAGDRRAAARATISIAALGAFDTRRKEDSLQWVRTGRAIVDKLDNALELDARLATAEGNVLMVSADAPNAEIALQRAVRDLRKLSADHPNLGASLAMLGASELGRGNVDAGERDLRDALARTEAALGKNHPDLASILVNVAIVDAARGHYADAVASTDRAVEILQQLYGKDHPMLINAYGASGQHARMRGDRAAAERKYREAARIAEASYGPDHPMVSQVALGLADLLSREGRGKEAVELATHAREIVARTADARDLGLAFADATLARALASIPGGDTASAIAHARAAVARCDAFPQGLPSGPCAIIHQALGDIAYDEHELEAAARAITTGTPDPLRLAEIRFALARLRVAHDRDAALELARLALREFPRDGDPAVRAALETWLAKPP